MTSKRSAPPENTVEEPAVHAAVDRLRHGGLPANRLARAIAATGLPDRRRRRERNAGRRPDRGEGWHGRETWERRDRHALVRGPHDLAPDLDRQPAASRLLGGRGIIVA